MSKEIEEMALVMCGRESCKTCTHFVEATRCAAIVSAKKLYNAGYSKQEWISVEERLPDEQAKYLVVDDEGYMEVALWTRQFGWFSHVNRGNKVTHWMPLPEPPKGGVG